ncbi:uncharacterized protein LOC125027942 [Penaeus chinensis]|uniref:uncharacterized protein LOC125027942 n=1 Tax=Penaeus chinensis TaxID=139456 RepID=UPI001FB8142C|nr:uncharacterized protein LOC125027942 [Penaeus chinensis]
MRVLQATKVSLEKHPRRKGRTVHSHTKQESKSLTRREEIICSLVDSFIRIQKSAGKLLEKEDVSFNMKTTREQIILQKDICLRTQIVSPRPSAATGLGYQLQYPAAMV